MNKESEARVRPDDVYNDLIADAGRAKKRKLTILHEVLADYVRKGGSNFSVAAVGRMSQKAGGPAAQTIRNRPFGDDYRRLVEAWADDTKVEVEAVLPEGDTGLYDLVRLIEDPALRVKIGSVIADRNRFKRENAILRQSTEIVIDRRPQPAMEVHEPLKGLLSSLEIEALQHVLSEDAFHKCGMSSDETGRVKLRGRIVFKAGFMSALKKVVEAAA